MTPRVSLVMSVFDQVELTKACLESLRATTEPFHLVVIDNGSADATRELFERFAYPFPLTFEHRDVNTSVIAVLNRAWRLATTEYVCLLHNDTELITPDWLGRLLRPFDDPSVGMTGLFGAKRIRRSGNFAGRTIVHSLASGPTVRAPWEEVAALDCVCMCLARQLMEQVGGLDESLGFYHAFDKDLSLAVRERGRRCLAVHAPFHHRGGGTRTREFAARPDRERTDLTQRNEAIARFIAKWGHRLPCDVRAVGDRVADWVRGKLTSAIAR